MPRYNARVARGVQVVWTESYPSNECDGRWYLPDIKQCDTWHCTLLCDFERSVRGERWMYLVIVLLIDRHSFDTERAAPNDSVPSFCNPYMIVSHTPKLAVPVLQPSCMLYRPAITTTSFRVVKRSVTHSQDVKPWHKLQSLFCDFHPHFSEFDSSPPSPTLYYVYNRSECVVIRSSRVSNKWAIVSSPPWQLTKLCWVLRPNYWPLTVVLKTVHNIICHMLSRLTSGCWWY